MVLPLQQSEPGTLGHTSVAFTMDTYSHIIDGMQEQAIALLDDVLPEGALENSVAKLSLET